MTPLERFLAAGRDAGCPVAQMESFAGAGVVLQPRQLAASAAARLCDRADGPTAVGYGGARGGGKSHWLLAQMGVDDCQRVPGLKCLLLRKVGKSVTESFDDLRRWLFVHLPHEFSAHRGTLTFRNGSRIIAGTAGREPMFATSPGVVLQCGHERRRTCHRKGETPGRNPRPSIAGLVAGARTGHARMRCAVGRTRDAGLRPASSFPGPPHGRMDV